MTDRWLYAWGFASISLGGASLIVPLYVVALGGDAFTLGVLAGLAAFVGVPGALVFGRLADRTGKRRTFVLFAIALVTATLVVVPFISSIALVIVANAVVWFAFAAAVPVLTLLAVVDVPPSAWSKRIATLNEFQGVGWALGLVIGAVWTAAVEGRLDLLTAQRTLVLLYAASGAVGFALAATSLPPDPGPGAGPSPRQLRRALRASARFNVRGVAFPFTPTRMDVRGLDPRRFVGRFTPTLATYFVAVFCFFVGFSAFFAPLPAYLTDLGFDTNDVFGLYVVVNLAAAVAFRTAGRLAAERDVALLQSVGLGTRALALPAVALVGMLFGVTVLGLLVTALVFVVIGLSWAIIAVTAGTLVTRLAPESIRGEAVGVYGALSAFAGGVGAVLGGALAAWGYGLAFATAGGLVGVGAVVVLLVRSDARRAVSEPSPASDAG